MGREPLFNVTGLFAFGICICVHIESQSLQVRPF